MRGFARTYIVLLALVAAFFGFAAQGTAAVMPYSDVAVISDGSGRPADIPSTSGTTHIVVPGTGDASGADQFGRMKNWFGGGERVLIVNYPATIGPIIGGLQAPGYDSSRDIAVSNTLVAVRDTDGHVTIYGCSQGAEGAGNAAELIHLLGLKPDEDVSLVLLADPRFPKTGLKEQLKNNHPVVSTILAALFDVQTNGQRNPADTGEIQVTSVAIIGDPVTGLETWYLNPVGFVVNSVSGFFMIHSGLGEQSANNLDELEVLKTWRNGNTTYVVYNAEHPMVQLLRYIGVSVSDSDARFWEFIAPRTVPGQDPAHAPGLMDWIAYLREEAELRQEPSTVASAPAVTRNGSYSITMPAEVATGGAKPLVETSVSTPDSSVSSATDSQAPAPVVSAGESAPQEPAYTEPAAPAADTVSDNQSEQPASGAESSDASEGSSPSAVPSASNATDTQPAANENGGSAGGGDGSSATSASTGTTSSGSDTSLSSDSSAGKSTASSGSSTSSSGSGSSAS